MANSLLIYLFLMLQALPTGQTGKSVAELYYPEHVLELLAVVHATGLQALPALQLGTLAAWVRVRL